MSSGILSGNEFSEYIYGTEYAIGRLDNGNATEWWLSTGSPSSEGATWANVYEYVDENGHKVSPTGSFGGGNVSDLRGVRPYIQISLIEK